MRRSGLFILMVVALSVGVLAQTAGEYKTQLTSTRQIGVERVTHYDPRVNYARIDGFMYLYPSPDYRPGVLNYDVGTGVGRGGYAPIYPRATAQLYSRTWYGYPSSSVIIKTKDLPATDTVNAQFEAWMVDEETGYRLSLGTFTTQHFGSGELLYNANTYFDGYDFLEITIEPLYDLDVNPGPVVVAGRIPRGPVVPNSIYGGNHVQLPPPSFYNPAPKQSKIVTEQFENY